MAVAGFLPGALVGSQVASLLFFLNPQLPLHPWPALRGVAAYGFLAGLLTLLAALPWIARERPRRAWRYLPWGLTGALAASALLPWTHASHYAYFLPPGINDRLIKTALWLTLATLISFYTALLHSLHRRRYGPRSRWGLGLVALLSVLTPFERREAYRPVRPQTRVAALEVQPHPQLLVVGLSSATLDVILPLAGEGRLPFLSTMLRQGAYGRLRSLTPHRTDALWTTLATGKYPYRHGVMGSAVYAADLLSPGAELRLIPVGIGFRQWGTLGSRREEPGPPQRTAQPLWEILPRVGVTSGLLGWPASSPAPAAASFALTDIFFKGAAGPLAARPEEIAERARLFRVEPKDLDPALLEKLGSQPPDSFRRSLAADQWRETLSFFLLDQHRDLDALFLALTGLDAVSRASFGGYSAAEFKGDRGRAAQEAADRLAAYYGELDRFLAQLWERRQGPRVLALVSPNGVDAASFWDRLRGGMSEQISVQGTTGGSPDGVLMLYGDGIRPGTLLTDVAIADLAPTLLYLLGLPVARDFDGQVITAAFDQGFLARRPLTFLPSYENLRGPIQLLPAEPAP